MAFVAILVLSAAVLLLLRMLPGQLAPLSGAHQLTIALILPVLGMFGIAWPIFALGVIGVMMAAPAITPAGLVLPHRSDVYLRVMLFMFALPLMPLLTYTVAAGGLTIAQLTYVNLINLALAAVMLRAGYGVAAPELASPDRLFLLMLATQIFMDVRGEDVMFGLRTVIVLSLNLGLLYLVVSRCVVRGAAADRMLMALIVAGCVLGAIATLESIRYWLLYDAMTAAIGADFDPISGYSKQRGGLLRARATFGESTGLSLFFGVMLVMLAALRQRIGSRLAITVAAMLLLSGLVFTFARVGYIVLVAGLPALFVIERRWGALVKAAVIGPVLFGVLTLLATVVPVISASMGTGEDAAGSVDYRSELMSAGLDMVWRNPLLGQSIEQIYAQLEFLKTGESIIDLVNQPLVIFMRAGVIGGTLYFALLAETLYSLFRQAPRMAPADRAAAAASFAGLIGLFASLITTSYGRNELTFVVLVATGAGLLARVRAARSVASPLPRPACPPAAMARA